MVFFPVFIIGWILRKTRYQFDLLMILSGICGYGAYFADLMTKSTPNWGSLRTNIPFIIGFIIIGLLNILTFLSITIYITKSKILDPIYRAIKQKNKIEKILRRQKEELSHFAHIMAHDLRSNLTSIKGYAQLMLKESDKNYCQNILNKIEDIQNILKTSVQLADLGKIIDKLELIDLCDFANEVAESIVPKHINVNISSLPRVLGDKFRLYQVWKNIFENAVKHGNPKEIKIYTNLQNSSHIIYIENDGDPISKRVLEEFHDPKFSLDFNKKGLGLKIVKRIIEAHNWEINIKNKPCTTIIIKIPTKPLNS
ncbi:MAG: sensor histidine kinase [Candidatus Odinarchaeota archaeon]